MKIILLTLIMIAPITFGNYFQLGNDINGEAANDFSGHSVSLSADGTIVAIGAPWNDGNGEDLGRVRCHVWIEQWWD